nr:hypothetical protein [Tanacetum cinerariifolium]
MKKMRNKGKVYPSSTPPPTGDNTLSILNLLPATILTLTIALSLEDKHVLAYMITLNTKKKTLKTHTTPLFECDCFDCYTSYWFKWDSSPNRELIHHAIEAFEETLTTSNENTKKKTKKKGQKGIQDSPKAQMGHRHFAGKICTPASEVKTLTENGQKGIQDLPDGQMGHCHFAEKTLTPAPEVKGAEGSPEKVEENGVLNVLPEEVMVVVERAPAMSQHNKGLARKVLPDVIGLFNWRLWSLWSPNV